MKVVEKVVSGLDCLREWAFRGVPGWWPRAYLTLLLFDHFRESRYAAPAYELRMRSRLVGIGKTTMYKGLTELVRAGLATGRDGFYVLTDRGVKLLSRYRRLEEEIVGSGDAASLERALEEVESLPEDTEFERYAKEYLRKLVEVSRSLPRAVKA